MRRSSSVLSHIDAGPSGSQHNEDDLVHSRSQEEKERRRREWLIQQERERQHEIRKQKMILEYEIKRARDLKQNIPKERSLSRDVGKDWSTKSPETKCKARPKLPIMSERLQQSSGTASLFKGPEGTQIGMSELRRIKVNIRRNIPETAASPELQREIVNPEDVMLSRREGEGTTPIFEREELKQVKTKVKEVEEHRTVTDIDTEIASKASSSKRRSVSSTPPRYQSQSPRLPSSSHHSRHVDSRHYVERSDHRKSHRNLSERERSGERSKGQRKRHEEKDTSERKSPRRSSENRSRERDISRDRSYSRERERRKQDRDSHYHRSSKDKKSYRDYRERSRERSRERRARERSRERRVSPARHYMTEQIPVPFYYENFHPRPMIMGPMMPFRGQVPLMRGRFPIMGHIRPPPPFHPRLMPQDAFRPSLPRNPTGFRRMF